MQPPDFHSLPEQSPHRTTPPSFGATPALLSHSQLRTWVIAVAIAVLHAAVLAWGMVVLT